MNIARKQQEGDFFSYNHENQTVEKAVENLRSALKAELQAFPNFDLAHVAENQFFWGNEAIFGVDILKLPGEHNQKNACAAMIATFDFLREKGLEMEDIFAAWQEGLSKFEGLPHRLKFVRELNGVKFYDDSIATTPGSAIAAIKSFVQPKILILGGSDKGADLSELISEIVDSSEDEIRKVILIGVEANKLAERLKAKHFTRVENLGLKTDINQIVKTAFNSAKSGDVVVMSPAHASFDMFKSYGDRGHQFVDCVNALT
jgi:UDP-N-acetylmuramoylalanine--D-glutamate ligase